MIGIGRAKPLGGVIADDVAQSHWRKTMSDLQERLRKNGTDQYDPCGLCDEAADALDQKDAEIARLHDNNRFLAELRDQLYADKAAHQSRIEELEADVSGLRAEVVRWERMCACKDRRIEELENYTVELENALDKAAVRNTRLSNYCQDYAEMTGIILNVPDEQREAFNAALEKDDV